MSRQDKLHAVDINYKVLAFKYPSTFNESITKAMLSIFHKGNNSAFDVYELQNLYSKQKSKRSINRKTKEEDILLIKENLSILFRENIVFAHSTIYLDKDNNLQEAEKHFLYLNKEQIIYEAKQRSEKAVIDYVIIKMQDSSYPYNGLASPALILNSLNRVYFEINNFLYSLIRASKLLIIPLARDLNKEIYEEYIIPGTIAQDKVREFLASSLIPSLKQVYVSLSEAGYLGGMSVEKDEINENNEYKVFKFCFFIIKLKTSSPSYIQLDEYNLAHLVLDTWLTLEEDPLFVLNVFPEIDIDDKAFAPFLSRYVNNFTSFTKNINIMRKFMARLPQLIEQKELINFFEAKGIGKQIIDSFLKHLPNHIISFNILKNRYLIHKGQIIPSINNIVKNNDHKKTHLGRFQFEVLARIFRHVEYGVKDVTKLLNVLKASPEEYKDIIFILARSHYNREDKEVDKELRALSSLISKDKETNIGEIIYSLPIKAVYSVEDFKKVPDKLKSRLLKKLALLKIACKDNSGKKHTLYLKKSALIPVDNLFLSKKPSYEEINLHFSSY